MLDSKINGRILVLIEDDTWSDIAEVLVNNHTTADMEDFIYFLLEKEPALREYVKELIERMEG